ncbi:MAG: flagellar biosynthesis protein FlgL [Sulfuricurvum sp.]
MRITTSMYFKNLYSRNNAVLSNDIYDLNKQIASAKKIQYASDDIKIYTETMRLDNEMVTLSQVKSSTQNALKFADQTDSTLGEFESNLLRMRKLLLNAANGSNDETSLDAIAKELREIEKHMVTLANTSINGQFLFSGSNIDTKPIDEDGIYRGNNSNLEAFSGSGSRLGYNITGADLFLGEKGLVQRSISTNVANTNLIDAQESLTKNSTIRDLMGDMDDVIDTINDKHFFYIQGTNSLGESFKEKIALKDSDKISDLLDRIGDFYGNSPELKVVDISINRNGQIEIYDKIKGSSKIDFHMVAATDFSGGADADVNDIDDLADGESDYSKILYASSPALKPDLFVKEFIKSGLESANGIPAIEGALYDRVAFSISGSNLTSSVAQIVKTTNAFATNSTKLSEVASGASLDGKSFVFEGLDVNGNAFSATIDLANAGSTFSIGVNTYDIYTVNAPRVAVGADDMTYKQLLDVINMITTANLPAGATAGDYDAATLDANLRGNAYLSSDGKIGFKELGVATTKASISLYDANSSDFSVGADASVMRFNANNAITLRDPKTDFFKTLDDIVTAVESYNLYPDASSTSMRQIGIENAIGVLDDLQDHVFRAHSKAGSQSNALQTSIERTKMLEISTMSLRSDVLDTDIAEAYLKLSQLELTYNAMLSTVGKISKLSLVNYL